MSRLRVSLFGKFEARWDGQRIPTLSTHKTVRELFSYLLMHRDRAHPREVLADVLWNDSDTDRPGRCLRKALWELRTILKGLDADFAASLLLVEPAWIELNPEADMWLDVAVFERAFDAVRRAPGAALAADAARAVGAALDLYQGGLQEIGFQDWYLYARERFAHMVLVMLDAMMDEAERARDYEGALGYGMRILRHERAHERTHRRMMQLYYRAGDRTAALRQYARCVAILDEELGVAPAEQTVALYAQIRADQLAGPAPVRDCGECYLREDAPPLSETLRYLRHVQELLAAVQGQVDHNIQELESAITSTPPPPSV